MIRARIRAVTLSCIIGVIAVLGLLIRNDVTVPEAMHLLGWWPIGLAEVLCTLLLTAILFAGPLFERVAEGEWKHGNPVRRIYESLNSWAGWRNYVAVSNVFIQRRLAKTPPAAYRHVILIIPGPRY